MNFLEWFGQFFRESNFLLPFYSTVSAALVLVFLQFLNRLVSETKKKIYGTVYSLDVGYRMERMACFLLKHTLIPHLEATKKILNGDAKLLDKMFLTDDFDILKAGPVTFDHLPEDIKVLIGCDDIELLQLIESLNHFATLDQNRKDLNDFVKLHMKNSGQFTTLDTTQQATVLEMYWDHVDRIKTEEERVIWFVKYNLVPRMQKYLAGFQFWLFATKEADKVVKKIRAVDAEFPELIPSKEFMEHRKKSGIQSSL